MREQKTTPRLVGKAKTPRGAKAVAKCDLGREILLWIARVWGPDGRLKELAAATGIPRSTIHYMVAGKRGVTAESALRLAKALGTTPEHWLAIANQDALATARPALAKSLARIRCVLSEEGK